MPPLQEQESAPDRIEDHSFIYMCNGDRNDSIKFFKDLAKLKEWMNTHSINPRDTIYEIQIVHKYSPEISLMDMIEEHDMPEPATRPRTVGERWNEFITPMSVGVEDLVPNVIRNGLVPGAVDGAQEAREIAEITTEDVV